MKPAEFESFLAEERQRLGLDPLPPATSEQHVLDEVADLIAEGVLMPIEESSSWA